MLCRQKTKTGRQILWCSYGQSPMELVVKHYDRIELKRHCLLFQQFPGKSSGKVHENGQQISYVNAYIYVTFNKREVFG